MIAINGEGLEPLSVVRVQWISSSDRDDAEELPQPEVVYEIDDVGLWLRSGDGTQYHIEHIELLRLLQDSPRS
jgi:hypothetical protein